MAKMVLRKVAVQTVLRIVSAVPILKTICGIEFYILSTFNRCAGIPNVDLLVPPMVLVQYIQYLGKHRCNIILFNLMVE